MVKISMNLGQGKKRNLLPNKFVQGVPKPLSQVWESLKKISPSWQCYVEILICFKYPLTNLQSYQVSLSYVISFKPIFLLI